MAGDVSPEQCTASGVGLLRTEPKRSQLDLLRETPWAPSIVSLRVRDANRNNVDELECGFVAQASVFELDAGLAGLDLGGGGDDVITVNTPAPTSCAIDVPLPAESRQALIDFYSDVAPELGVPSPPLATPASLDCGHRTPNPLPCLPLQARESCIAIAAGVAGWG